MKSVIRVRINAVLIGMLVGAVSLLTAERGVCQSTTEPAIVISFANIDEQLDDIAYLATAASEEMGQMSGLIKMQAQGFTRGINTKKSAGMLMYFDDGAMAPTTLAFLPIENMDDLLDTIAGFAELDEGDDIVTIIPDNGQEISMKKVGNYAFMSDSPEALERAPENPSKLLNKMADQYNISATVFPQRIPESLRQQALDLIELGYEQNMQLLDELEPMQAELQQESFDMQMEQMENLFNDTEQIVVAMAADEKAQAIYFDFVMTAKPGSKMVEQIAEAKKAGKSKFSGFLMDGASMTANMTTQITPDIRQQYQSMIETAQKEMGELMDANADMTDDQVEVATDLVNSLFDVFKDTVDAGRFDMGAMMMTDDGKMNFVMGAEMADPDKLEDAVKDVVKMAEKEIGDNVQFNLNAGSHLGTTMHEILIDVPASEEEAQAVFGDQITVVIGIGKDAVYFGIGDQPETHLKKAMDQSANASSTGNDTMMQVNVFMAPMLQFASGMPGAEMLEMISDAVQPGGDRIQIRSDYIENGTKTRFEIQDGVLQLLGAAGGMMGGMGGGADF